MCGFKGELRHDMVEGFHRKTSPVLTHEETLNSVGKSHSGPPTSPSVATVGPLFVLLGLRVLCMALTSLLLWLLLLRNLLKLVSFGLAELLGFLVQFIQVELSNYVLLMASDRDHHISGC